ncbi:uncharacterized protein B0I36DRAFT_329043 [Microdochium trichocladiopsis]|uniref:Uncharacterized protein n=1 Tax=Microdochium trichocladiopsis TaxID=1682393 RepID=A0A9P8XYY9_9PEZI|nr:uncharacterized protein B0I36DRAFT_329043 [Microdochium trichocladiopsis]KAH7025744.1 hypothetical protein B0I36DRAFT_329043 [Microdochium trichocladiopsis]
MKPTFNLSVCSSLAPEVSCSSSLRTAHVSRNRSQTDEDGEHPELDGSGYLVSPLQNDTMAAPCGSPGGRAAPSKPGGVSTSGKHAAL